MDEFEIGMLISHLEADILQAERSAPISTLKLLQPTVVTGTAIHTL